jgi:hypothetical protein
LFSQYAQQGVGERPSGAVSWVFPRPWYQDELDWMAAARSAPQAGVQPTMFTTRGTYVAPERPMPNALPTALYEYVAPSLSIAGVPHEQPPIAGTGFGGEVVGSSMLRNEAYSPLVPLAAVQAAEVMSRTLQRLPAGGARSVERSPALRNVLAAMLARASQPVEQQPTRLAMQAPELVTPPAPRLPDGTTELAPTEATQATQVAERYAEHRAQIVELQRIARHSAEREIAARSEPAPTSATLEARGAHAEAEVRQRIATARGEEQRRNVETQQATAQAERARIEERIAQRVAERTGAQRLHEQARSEAAAHARAAASEPNVRPTVSPQATQVNAPSEVIAAIAALPPELASFLAQRSSTTAAGATQAIDELGEAYRTIELIARSAAVGGTFQSTRGPRLMMPVGLGGLVTAVDRVQTIAEQPAMLTGQPQLAPRSATRVPTLSWVSAPTVATTSAFGAATSAAPAALGHVAWADRWLARFAGASQQSLDTLSVHAGVDSTRGLQALAAAAPHNVFVSSSWFDAQRDGESIRFDTTGRTIVTPSATLAMTPSAIVPSGSSAPASVVRYDDDAETPDDVFAAISEAASRGRTPTVAQAPAASTAPASRATLADTVAHAAPGAPGAGFAAQLASSPFAPALRHVLSLPNATSFDVRALFGGALSATYLAGLLVPGSHELDVTSGRGAPAWATLEGAEPVSASERAVPSWDATYVSPDVESSEPGERGSEAAAMPTLAPLTTLRTALLSWDSDAGDSRIDAPAVADVRTRSITPSAARAMVDAMSLPMLGETTREEGAGESWTSPGMVGERARTWSVAQERSSSDLAFDFVTPELVLAARVYGLGPVEAAQAARLAIAGPGQLTAMAGTVDRTFVQAMAIEADRRERQTRTAALATAYPMQTGELAAVVGPSPRTFEPEFEAMRPEIAASTGAAFGVERRAPRGAFLWPSATVAALQLNAAAPDGQQSMSVAALELLAAQTVAELGTYAALSDQPTFDDVAAAPVDGATAARSSARADSRSFDHTDERAIEPSERDVLGVAAALVPAARRARFDALYLSLGQSPVGRTWSPAARAARALALAGRGEDAAVSARERATTAWDVLPVVYAMDDHDEAMPVVASSGADFAEAAAPGNRVMAARRAMSTLAAGGGEAGEPSFAVDVRPGLGALSARAGEALGSYVAPPSAAPSAPAREREVGAVLRAPTAAQEMVQTGRPSGRFGGGEVEIPTWFEAAARKMFESQSGTMGDGISMAELTLISTTPSNQIAASTRTAPAAAPASPASASAGQAKGEQQIDVEKLANDIYRHILVLMDVARARNGEPYL